MRDEDQRKFHNPTDGYQGAVKFDEENKPKGVAVPPHGDVWLTAAEERLTAEAPTKPENNPFIKEWDAVVETAEDGHPIAHEKRLGVLVLSEEPARRIASDRFTPSTAEAERAAEREQDAAESEQEPSEEITGAPPMPKQPPVEGKPAPDEHVGTPGAVAANDEYLAAEAAKKKASAEDGPTPVGADGPKGQEEVGVRTEKAEPALV